jgi:hypothetical protein
MIELRCIGCGYPLDIFSDRQMRVICRLCQIKGRWTNAGPTPAPKPVPKAQPVPPSYAEGASCSLGG